MLKTIDVLIGVSMIMLLSSMIVMAVTHFIMVIFQGRGRSLRTGLSELLTQLSPEVMNSDVARRVVSKLLSFPQLKSATGKPGAVVHREEFLTILLQLAANNGPVNLETGDRQALVAFLKANGIDDPGRTLGNIRELALKIERTNPELSADARRDLAVLHAGSSRFVGGIHAWFDRTIDRASERYTYYTRLVTYVAGLVVALALQLDVIALVNRLSVDDSARKAIVTRAIEEQGKFDQNLKQATQARPEQPETAVKAPPASSVSTGAADQLRAEYYKTQQNVAGYSRDVESSTGMFTFPTSLRSWSAQFRMSMLPGIFLTTILLSLGAPFWYETLSELIQLRSVAAQKDDQERAARSAPTTAVVGAANEGKTDGSNTPDWLRGEQGDLAMVG